MSDFATSTIDYWKAHPSLWPLVEGGHLAFARYDAGNDAAIDLHDRSERLGPGTIRNPLVVLANYFFDSIPHDAFSVKNGELYEYRATLLVPDHDVNLDAPDILDRIRVELDRRRICTPYYDDPELDTLLDYYQRSLIDAEVPVPL